MKKRIIAALTALVMVVTMIPSSAFAATLDKDVIAADAIKALVEGVAGETDGKASDKVTVFYTNDDLKLLNDATVAYENLTAMEKDDFATKYTTQNWAKKLEVAQKLFAGYINAVQEYKAKADKDIVEGTLTADSYNAMAAQVQATGTLGDKYKAMHEVTVTVDGVAASNIVKDANIGTRPTVDMTLIGTQLKEKLTAAQASITYKTADVDTTHANKYVPKLFSAAGVIDANFKTALTKVNSLNAGSNITSVAYTELNDEIEAVLADLSTAANGKCIDFIKLAKGYEHFIRVYKQKLDFTEATDKMDAAHNSLNSNGSQQKPGSTENYPAVDYTTGAYDDTFANVSTLNENDLPKVKEDNYAAAKAAYDAAKVVYDQYKDNKFGTITDDTALEGTPGNDDKKLLHNAILSMRSYVADNKATADVDEENYWGTLEQYERALEAKAIIENLAKKTTFDEAAYKEFMKLVKYAGMFSSVEVAPDMAFDTFVGTTTNFNRLDNYFAATGTTTVARTLQNKYKDHVVQKAIDFKETISGNKLALEYGKKLHDAVAKLPDPNKTGAVTVKDKNSIDEIIKIFDAFKVASKELFGATVADVTFDSANNGIKVGSDKANFAEAKAKLDEIGGNLNTSSFTYVDLQKLIAVSEQVVVALKDTNFVAANTKLEAYAGNVDALNAEKKFDFTKAIDTTLYDTLTGLETAYNDAVRHLNADQKAGLDSTKVAIATENSKAIAMYKKMVDGKTTLELEKIVKIIKEEMHTVSSVTGTQIKVDDAFFAKNKKALDKVDAIFAADKDLERFLRQLNGNADGALAYDPATKTVTGTAKYAAEVTILDTVRTEYETYMEKPTVDQQVKAVEKLIAALPKLTDKSTYAEVKAAIAPWDKAQQAYNKLTKSQQVSVNNAKELTLAKESIKTQLIRTITAESAVILKYKFGEDYTDSQKAFARDVKTVLDDALLKGILTVAVYVNVDINGVSVDENDMFPGTEFGTEENHLFDAIKAVVAEAYKPLVAEIKPVYKTIIAVTGYNAQVSAPVVNKPTTAKEAKVIVDAIKAYNGLSQAAKDLLVDPKLSNIPEAKDYSIVYVDKTAITDKLFKYEKEAKTFFLEYAKIDAIADQTIEEGSYAKPEIVVKDFSGNVIDAKEYTVVYENNDKAGVAKVVVTATGTKYEGTVSATFNVVIAEKPVVAPVVPTGVKVIGHDHGILKVTCDKVEGIEGLTYKFFVKRSDRTKWAASNETTENVVTFRNLTKNGKYEVKAVTMVNGVASEAAMMEGTVYANRIGTKSAVMYKPSITKVTISKGIAKITVKKLNYNNVKYTVGYKRATASKFNWLAYNGKTVKTVKGLKKGVKYTFTAKYKYTSTVSGTTVYSSKWAKYVTKVAR